MPEVSQAIQLLDASVDEDDESHFRFLYQGKWVKYVTIAPALFTAEDMCFEPSLIPLMPPFPAGDWNDGYIARNPEDGLPYFARAVKTQLPGIRTPWHSTHLDHLDLVYGDRLRPGVYKATTPSIPFAVVAKFARFAWEIDALENETVAYQWIEGKDIGPKFFGHLVEEGRIIGFVIENIANARHANPDDLTLCQTELSHLHRLGIIHGDVNQFNFLIADGHARLVDFETARKCEDPSSLETELRSLVDQLNDASGRGGTLVEWDYETPSIWSTLVFLLSFSKALIRHLLL